MRVHPASVLAPVNNTPAQGQGQVTAFVQKFKFGSPGTVSIPHTSSARHMPRSSKIDIKILYSATVREILSFFIPPNLSPSFRYFFAPSLLEAQAGQIPMPLESNRRSSFGINCVQCSNELIAPERSEYRNERQVHHVWHCPKCCACFGSLLVFPAGSKSMRDIKTGDVIFPSLLVA